MIWPSFQGKLSDPFPPRPVGLKRFWTVAREHVTSEKELAAWKPQALCIVNITVCASKAQPHAWVPTYIQTHKVQVCTAQPDSTENIPKYTTEGSLKSVDIKKKKKIQGQLKHPIHSSRLKLRPWSWHTCAAHSIPWIEYSSTFPNLIAKHKWKGTASSMHKKVGPTWDCGKNREPCQTRGVWCVQSMTVCKIPLFHFQQHPVVLKWQLSAGKREVKWGALRCHLHNGFVVE